ncbi:MAG: O-antigen ligase family protein [Candidatus Wenzhouxiangella sp. M2_3B_020]
MRTEAHAAAVPVPHDVKVVSETSWLARATALVLFAGLAFGLVVPKVAGGSFLLLALLGIIWLEPLLLRRHWRLDAHERLLTFSVVAFVLVWLVAWLAHGLDPVGADDVGRIARLLLVVPVAVFLARVDGLERAWWGGLAVGCAVAGAYAIGFAWGGEPGAWAERVGGPTNPIYFGGVVLAFAVMLLPRPADASLDGPTRMAVSAAIALGLIASALSGSRGAWLALAPLLVLYLLTLGARQRPLWRYGVPLAIVAAAVLLALIPGVPLGERVADAVRSLSESGGGLARDDTLAIRWALWDLSIERIGEGWLFGHGPGGFRAALEQAVASGELPAWMLEYHHPHNQLLSVLLIAGLPGIAALALLFGVPLARFARLWRSGLERTRLIGWSGLAAVTVLAVMSLGESIFQRNSGIVWFVLLTAVAYAIVRVRYRRELASAPRRRTLSLSVVMICRDEADRIEQALASVAGWADEIVVLDSGSTDGTPEICRRYTSSVEITDWPGYGPQKRRAMARATGDWVLSLDADEVVSEALRREIDLVLSQPEPHYDGYRLPWLTRAFGRDLHFGHWARAPLRLVRRDAAEFTDAPVHEKLVMTGPSRRTGLLEGPLIHHVFRDPEHARAKLAGYARIQAAQRHAAGRRAGRLGAWPRALFNGIDNFVLRGAFLDGRAGWRMSVLQAAYTLEKYKALARLGRGERIDAA